LQIQYSTFIEKLKGEQPRFYSALKLMSPKLIENQVVLTFQNRTLLDEYKMRVRPALISFLRSAFLNDMLEIIEVVAESAIEKSKLYSDSEKLQYMINKNPALQKLKTKFNLDFD
jgi:DNA polymerase-3 subunit gamma/tau